MNTFKLVQVKVFERRSSEKRARSARKTTVFPPDPHPSKRSETACKTRSKSEFLFQIYIGFRTYSQSFSLVISYFSPRYTRWVSCFLCSCYSFVSMCLLRREILPSGKGVGGKAPSTLMRFENAYISMRLGLPSTLIRWVFSLRTHQFEKRSWRWIKTKTHTYLISLDIVIKLEWLENP